MNDKHKSLGVNAVLNAIKSSLSILFPLIIYPYVFRVLHSENIGRVNFALSIVSYFSMFAMLGITQYAVREGARIRNKTYELNRFASQIFTINVISTLISYLLLILSVILIDKIHSYSKLILICSASILFTTLGIEWINTIFEDYLYVTIRSIAINIILLALTFLFVKNEKDIYIYALLSILGNVLTSLINWKYCRKYVSIKITKDINFRKHCKPISILFANTLATNIYVNSDITMLGWFVGDYNVGIYSLAVKIYSVIKNIIAAIYTVSVPRISYYLGNNDYESAKKLYTKLVSSIVLLLLPMSAGIISVSTEIVLFMGGSEYIGSIVPLRILGISLIGAILAGLLTYCLNIPLGKEKINFQATLLSAVINVGLNIFLIKILKQNGAALTTVISEFSVFFYCLYKSRRELELYLCYRKVLVNLAHALIGMFIIFIASFAVHSIVSYSMISLLFVVIISIVLYGFFLIIVKNEIVVEILKKRR